MVLAASTAYAANDNSKMNGPFTGIRVYSREIAAFTGQRTAFTGAKSAILQSVDFNFRVERARKFLIHEANILKTDPVTLPFSMLKERNWEKTKF